MKCILFALAAVFFCPLTPAAEKFSEVSREPAALFASNDTLEISIQANWKNLNSLEKGKGSETGTINHGQEKTQVVLSPRGEVRRELCQELPPFRIDLPKDNKSTLFAGLHSELKFVTHCKTNSAEINKEIGYVLAEYAQYRFLQAAGFAMLKVRLANVTYLNPDGSIFSKGYGFFLESKKDLEKRLRS